MNYKKYMTVVIKIWKSFEIVIQIYYPKHVLFISMFIQKRKSIEQHFTIRNALNFSNQANNRRVCSKSCKRLCSQQKKAQFIKLHHFWNIHTKNKYVCRRLTLKITSILIWRFNKFVWVENVSHSN